MPISKTSSSRARRPTAPSTSCEDRNMNNPSSHRAVEAHYHQLSDAEMARIGGSEGEAEIGAVVGEVLVASGPAAPELAVVIGCAIIGYEVEKMLDGGIDAAN